MTCDLLIAQNSYERALFPNLLGQRGSTVTVLQQLVHKYWQVKCAEELVLKENMSERRNVANPLVSVISRLYSICVSQIMLYHQAEATSGQERTSIFTYKDRQGKYSQSRRGLRWVGAEERRETNGLGECNCCSVTAFHGCRHHFLFPRLRAPFTHSDRRVM